MPPKKISSVSEDTAWQKEVLNMIQEAVSQAEDRLTAAFEAKLELAVSDLRVKLDYEKARCNELQLQLKKAHLENNRLEQYSRRSNLRILGLEMEEHADCKQIVANFLSEKLKDRAGNSITVTRDDLDAAHPLPVRATPALNASTTRRHTRSSAAANDAAPASTSTTGPPPKPIIVRFHARELRDKIIRSRRSLKSTGLTIQEDLTAANAKLLTKLSNDSAFKCAWTWEGRVFAIPKGSSRAKRFDIWEANSCPNNEVSDANR